MSPFLHKNHPYHPIPRAFWMLFTLLVVWTVALGGFAVFRYHEWSEQALGVQDGRILYQAPDTQEMRGGLFATFYASGALQEPLESRIVPGQLSYRTEHEWGQLPQDQALGARLTGWLEAPGAGDYQFIINVKEGARVWIDGTMLFDDWDTLSLHRDMGTLELPGGLVPIHIEWHNRTRNGWLGILWQAPGGTWEFIPGERLRPDPHVGRPES